MSACLDGSRDSRTKEWPRRFGRKENSVKENSVEGAKKEKTKNKRNGIAQVRSGEE